MIAILAILLAADVHTEATNLAKKAMPQDRYHQIMTAMTTGMTSSMRSMMKDDDQAKLDDMMRKINGVVSYDEMIGIQADYYSSHFTVAELQKLSQLYDEPVLQKMFALTPQMMQEMMPRIQALMAPRIQKILEEERAKPSK